MGITKSKFKKAVDGTGGIMLSIAKNLGVSRTAVYDFCNKYPAMMDLRYQEEEKILDIAENGLFTKAKEKEMWAVKYLLATKGKRRGYIEKTEQVLEHKGDNQLKVIIEERKPDGDKTGTKSKAEPSVQSS